MSGNDGSCLLGDGNKGNEVRDTFKKPGKLVRNLVKCHLVEGLVCNPGC